MQIRQDELRDRLAGIAEELGDLALERLRSAVDGDDGDRAAAVTDEKRLTRARRAVEKAVNLLDAPGGRDDDL
jgi:hypothetical protein